MKKIGLSLCVISWLGIVLGKSPLSTTTYPINYKIWLNMSLDHMDNVFNGVVEIKIGVNTITDEIILNSYELEVNTVELFKVESDSVINIPVIKYMHGGIYYTSSQMMEVGKEYILKLTYSGAFNDQKMGIYKSYDDEVTSNTIIATNFLPQFARRAFPCYDEIHFKTPFTLSITHPEEYDAISNMQVRERKTIKNNGITTTTFYTTPLLSTHSIAFAVINYQSLCKGNTLQMCAFYDSQHNENDVKFVLEVAEVTLKELEVYFGAALDLQKLDIIPVHSSSVNVNGNYGLLMNKDISYYYDPLTSNIEQTVDVVRHTIQQIVNLYFINVITPDIWTDVWINHGISLMLANIIAEKKYPELDMTDRFFESFYEIVFDLTEIKPTGDLSYHDILKLYDMNKQYKSAGIMYMLKNILGNETFFKGLKRLFTGDSKSYSTETFFQAFQSLAIEGEKIPNIYNLETTANTWLTQISYPIFQISDEYITGVLTLTDEEYDNDTSIIASMLVFIDLWSQLIDADLKTFGLVATRTDMLNELQKFMDVSTAYGFVMKWAKPILAQIELFRDPLQTYSSFMKLLLEMTNKDDDDGDLIEKSFETKKFNSIYDDDSIEVDDYDDEDDEDDY